MRLFVAINFPARIRKRILSVATRLRSETLPMNWTAEENLHLTLRFIGSVEADAVVDISEGVRLAAQAVPSLAILFQPLGAFPSPHQARVVWLGVEPSPVLRYLRQELEYRLSKTGLPRDGRLFHPHVTLGRVGRGATIAIPELLSLGPLPSGLTEAIPVRSLDLVQSRLTAAGPNYEVMQRAPLTGSPRGSSSRSARDPQH